MRRQRKILSQFHGVDRLLTSQQESRKKPKNRMPAIRRYFLIPYAGAGRQRIAKIVAVTAAMPDGTGLKRFQKSFRTGFLMWGLPEEHAVTFAAGMAAGGLKAGSSGLFFLPAERPMIRFFMMSVSRTCRWFLPLTGQDWLAVTERPIMEPLICHI